MLLITLLACQPDAEPFVLELPEGFPEPRVPIDNPLTVDKVELGRRLFHDKRLSGNETQSCASCHDQALAFTDGRRVGEGSTGELHPRNANGLTNVAYNATLTWGNPLLTDLETQLLLPIFGDAPVEMGASPGEDAVLERLRDDPELMDLFEASFPDAPESLSWDHAVKAIAAFSRTLISGDSRYDQYAYQGQRSALSEQELRGLTLFFSEELECQHCHGGFNFSEATTHADSPFDSALFQNTGLYNLDGTGDYPRNNTGVYEITGVREDMGRFRAPSLRNVSVTAPYLHDGSAETLEEVIRIYERGGRLIEDGPNAGDGRASPWKSGLVAGFTLTDEERADLIVFLEALTDEAFLNAPEFAAP